MSPKKTSKPIQRHGPTTSTAKSGHVKKSGSGYRFPTQRIPLMILFLVISLGGASMVLMRGGNSDIKELGYEIVAEYKHDERAFTQGLYFDGTNLYESTGSPRNVPSATSSSVRISKLNGDEMRIHELDQKYFGEGLAKVDDRLIQLTFKSRVALIYDLDLNQIDEISYDWEEGWGLAYDGRHLIVSDGTAKLRFVDPNTFAVERELTVRSGNWPLSRLNELEYINNRIYANVWHDDSIYVIDPKTGNVESRINLSRLFPRNRRPHNEAVLNGIAYHPENKTLLVTGKLWPKLFEIRLMDK